MLNEHTGQDVHQFRPWNMKELDFDHLTTRKQMRRLRVFLKWVASIEAVPAEQYEMVMMPNVGHSDRRNDRMLEAETAERILEYLSRQPHDIDIEAPREPGLVSDLDRIVENARTGGVPAVGCPAHEAHEGQYVNPGLLNYDADLMFMTMDPSHWIDWEDYTEVDVIGEYLE